MTSVAVIPQDPPAKRPAEILTTRELEVVVCLARGMTNAEIARMLWLSPGTVRKHLENVYRKLDVHTRTAAVARVVPANGSVIARSARGIRDGTSADRRSWAATEPGPSEGAIVIETLPDLPPNVVGIRAVGRVESSDYAEVLDPAVETALRENDKIRLLYVLGEAFEGYSPGAAWEDTKLGLAHWSAWERIAIVTDANWIRDAVKALGWMLPGEVKVFDTDDLPAATTWVGA